MTHGTLAIHFRPIGPEDEQGWEERFRYAVSELAREYSVETYWVRPNEGYFDIAVIMYSAASHIAVIQDNSIREIVSTHNGAMRHLIVFVVGPNERKQDISDDNVKAMVSFQAPLTVRSNGARVIRIEELDAKVRNHFQAVMRSHTPATSGTISDEASATAASSVTQTSLIARYRADDL